MATKSLKGFGWFVCGVLVAPPCYLVSSWVAAERARVESLERAIVAAQSDIRDLETEFQTRANHAQLERWNGDLLALAAPRPEQFVAGEDALAALHSSVPGDAAYVQASYIVPSGLHDTRIRLDAAEAEAALAAAAQPRVAPIAPVATPAAAAAAKPAPAPATPKPKTAVPAARVALAAAATPSPVRAGPAPAPERKRAQAVAMLDRTLLSDSTLGDLAAGARREVKPR
ncbi:hypothetical protein [Sphingomonas baiyangensis]|nr:hypothetical protein [Sphingomonas baiyangensis]